MEVLPFIVFGVISGTSIFNVSLAKCCAPTMVVGNKFRHHVLTSHYTIFKALWVTNWGTFFKDIIKVMSKRCTWLISKHQFCCFAWLVVVVAPKQTGISCTFNVTWTWPFYVIYLVWIWGYHNAEDVIPVCAPIRM